MTVDNIILIVSIAVAAVFALWFAMRGLLRGWLKAIFTTANIAVSAALACFLSRDFTTVLRDYIYPLVTKVLEYFGISLESMLSGYDEVIALLPLFIGVLLTPVLFLSFFFIFRTVIGFILSFIHRPRRRVINEEGEKVKVKRHVPVLSRVLGALIGVVNGLLLLSVILVPVTGFANLGVTVGDEFYQGTDTSAISGEDGSVTATVYFVLEDYVKPATKNWLLDTTYNTVGKPMFNYMITTVYDDTEVFLETELVAAVKLVKKGSGLAGSDFAQMNDETVESLHDMVDIIEESVLMPEFAASLLAEMGSAWSRGDTVFGMERPVLGELLDPTFDALLRILATTDRELLVADLNTLIDFLDILVKNQILSNMGDSAAVMDTLSQNPDLISNMMALFEENPHLAPMGKEIKALCVRAVTKSLDMADAELTGKLTESINAFKDDPEQLSQELGTIVSDYMADQNIQANVSKEVTDEVAQAINKEFADRDQVSEEEVIDFVLNYASESMVDENGGIDLDGDGIADGDIDDIPGDVPGM